MRKGLVLVALYAGTVLGANWAVERYGLVPVGFGLLAPAGVWFAGVAFTLRDAVQERLGKAWALIAIALGCALSLLVSPRFALASALAFGLSELADLAVYTPLRERGLVRAVAASNLVGLAVDSAVFLWLAFGSLGFFWGQALGKLWTTLIAVLLIEGGRRAVLPRHA